MAGVITLKNNIYTCIEIGSYEIKLIVCNLREERLFVLARKSIESIGIERGQITNFDKLVGQIKKIKELAESDLRQPLKEIILTVSPVDVVIDHVMGKVNLDVKQPISSDDVRKLFRQVMEHPHVETHLPIGLIPRLFRIDESHVVQNPRGLSGMSLGIEVSRVLMPTTTISNLVHAVENSDFKVEDIVLGSVAEALMSLATPEMYSRTCYINVGHGVTTLTIVHDGKVLHTRSLSIGGRDVTRAISEAFNVSEEVAGQLKMNYGKVISPSESTSHNQVIYIDDASEEIKTITRGMLNEVVTERTSELFKEIKNHVVDEMRLREQEYHYALAGGMAELPNVLYALQNQLPMPATIQRPTMLGVRDSKYSSLVGAAIFAHELTLLVGAKTKPQPLEFDVEPEKKTLVGRTKAKKDIIPQIEKIAPPESQKKIENTRSLKDEIAGVATTRNETVKKTDEDVTKRIPVFGEFDDDIPLLMDEALETAEDEYIDHKLENSGMLVRFFDKIFNESDDGETKKNNE